MAVNSDEVATPRPAGLAFWAILAILSAYVAACTVHRDNNGLTDDWEHHRAILALSKDLWKPGNPTFATDDPSIRYSPYSIALALIVRAGGFDAYAVLGWAGVANTVLSGIALRAFLASYGRRDLAAPLLIVMVVLWGQAPGYANSYALADLPIHQVNPSAFSWALSLFMWAWFRRMADSGLRPSALAGISLLGSLAMLSHGMTGAAAVGGLGVVALAAPARRGPLIAGVVVVGLAMLAVCSAWPWYDFVSAIRGSKRDNDYWYNKYILFDMLAIWSVPAAALSLLALPLRRVELVRFGYLGALIYYALSFSSVATKSALTARFPMIGVFFLHVCVAAYLGDSGVFRPVTWPRRLRELARQDYAVAARPILDVVACLILAYCLVPQLWSIVRDPALARAYVAPALKFEDKQDRLKPRYDRLLAKVGDREVVLSDPDTSWPVPSSKGRVVVASHFEFFSGDQKERAGDVQKFFSAGASTAERAAILDRYKVRWILLSRAKLGPEVHAALLRPEAVVASDKDLTLMDAKVWEGSLVPRP